jgi:monoamine oxidase
MVQRWDVVVIGAGMAGLAAVDGLAGVRRRLRVLVLEARDRPGGRVATYRDPGWPVPIEAGAEFVHGLPPAIEALRRQARARRIEVPQRHWVNDGRGLRQADETWRRAMELLGGLPTEPPDRSYAQLEREAAWRGRESATVRRLARQFVEGFNAAPADDIGVVTLGRQTAASEEIEGDRLFRIAGGYGTLVEALARRAGNKAELRFGAVVQAVRWRRGDVELALRGALGQALEPMRCRALISTVPLAVLQRRTIGFRPALPRFKQAAIAALRVGPVVRVLLRLSALPPPIVQRRLTFLHVPGAPFPTFWRAADDDTPVLVAWAAGPAVAQLPATDEARVKAALASLARGLGDDRRRLAGALAGWRVFDWQRDPFARGAYTFAPPGSLGAAEALAASIEDTLFFAGEATDTSGETGTVHGALATGHRAARQVMAALR